MNDIIYHLSDADQAPESDDIVYRTLCENDPSSGHLTFITKQDAIEWLADQLAEDSNTEAYVMAMSNDPESPYFLSGWYDIYAKYWDDIYAK